MLFNYTEVEITALCVWTSAYFLGALGMEAVKMWWFFECLVQECLWKSHNKCSSFSWRLVHLLFSVIGYSGRNNGKWDCDKLISFQIYTTPSNMFGIIHNSITCFYLIASSFLPSIFPALWKLWDPLANFIQTGRQGRGIKDTSFLHILSE